MQMQCIISEVTAMLQCSNSLVTQQILITILIYIGAKQMKVAQQDDVAIL